MQGKFLFIVIFCIVIAVSFSLFNYFYLSKIIPFHTTLYIVALLLVATPFFVLKYIEQSRVKELEDNFPIFLRDFVESVRGGMDIPQAFKSITSNDYRSLTPYVKKIAAQLDWGIPVEKVLTRFSKESGSRLIGRIVSSVIEAHRFGGNLADTFEALSKTALEVEKLRTERKLYMNSQMITGYIIFFVFLGVMIALGKFLVPSLGQVSTKSLSTLSGETQTQANFADQYKDIFRNLILIQGLFAGLIVGKMAEGAMISGIRHSFIMMFIGILVFTLFG